MEIYSFLSKWNFDRRKKINKNQITYLWVREYLLQMTVSITVVISTIVIATIICDINIYASTIVFWNIWEDISILYKCLISKKSIYCPLKMFALLKKI